jgi:hypothetical protein
MLHTFAKNVNQNFHNNAINGKKGLKLLQNVRTK